MVEFVFTSRKQYWSAVKNFQKNINQSTREGRSLRSSFKNLTGNVKYSEKNFNKRFENGKIYSVKEIRKDFAKARTRAERNLKKDWLQAKKDGVTKLSFKKFKEINKEPDYEAIQEGYNSPT